MKHSYLVLLAFILLLSLICSVEAVEERRISLSATEKFLDNHPFFAEASYCNGAYCGSAYRKLTGNRKIYYDFYFFFDGGLFEEKIYIVKDDEIPKSIRWDKYEDRCKYSLLDALLHGGITEDPRTWMGGGQTVPIDYLIDVKSYDQLQKSYDFCLPKGSDSFMDNQSKVLEILKLVYGEKSSVVKDFQNTNIESSTHYFYITKDEYYRTKTRKKLTRSREVNIYDGDIFSFYVYDYAIYIRDKKEFANVRGFLREDAKQYERLKERSKLTKPYDL